MPHYVSEGQIPRKRHVQFRQPDGSLYAEQVFGTHGFSGPSSILYHTNLPTSIAAYEYIGDLRPKPLADPTLRMRHLKTNDVAPFGDAISGRRPLMFNDDVQIDLCRPTELMSGFYKNADGDDLLYVHEGSGVLETMFGSIEFRDGDYLAIPRGTIYRLTEATPTRYLVIEAASHIESPRRYRNEYGQLLEHSPFCERDFRLPKLATIDEKGRFQIRIKARGNLTACFYDYHPFDIVGWDGCVYPFAFNISDFEPITGSIHQPPPTHQNFEAHNFVVCSFCPRALDYHPEAIPIPYNHSNLDSDEMLYYCNDKFGSRTGIEEGSITLHPSGLPHGPQPGAVEASLGKTRTEELAVMVDTFRPLKLTEFAAEIEDSSYSYSWKRK